MMSARKALSLSHKRLSNVLIRLTCLSFASICFAKPHRNEDFINFDSVLKPGPER